MKEIENIFIGVNKSTKEIPKEKLDSLTQKNKGKCSSCGFHNSHNPFAYIDGGSVFSLCSLCYYTLSLNHVPLEEKGTIIMFPHLSQKDINAIVRAYWYVESLDSDFDEEKDSVSILMTLLEQQEVIANKYYSNGISKPDLVIQLFYELTKKEYSLRRTGAVGLRWLPPKELFEKDILVWREKDFSSLKIETWRDLIIKVKANLRDLNEKG